MGFLDQVVGSFSTGAADNPTVAMMDAAFAAEGLAWRYVNCEVEPDDLAAAVAGAAAMGWQGFNCSMPHKQSVIPLLDALSPSAELCQAVNCVVRDRDGNGWSGHNTDGAGFVASCTDVIELAGISALVIGSGGAASAIAVELALAGAATVHIASRNRATASALAGLVDGRTNARAQVVTLAAAEPLVPPHGVGLVVNATPVGMTPATDQTIAVEWGSLGDGLVVGDVVFSPAETVFLRQAEAAGARTVDGTGMLVNQAAENIRLWSGVRPDRAPMRAALEVALGL